jgi:hypothetical protein
MITARQRDATMKKSLVLSLSLISLFGASFGLLSLANSQPLETNATMTSSWDGSSRTAYTSRALTYNGASYYPIYTASELAYIATDSNSWSKNFILMADIDLASKNWTPIALNKYNGNADSNHFSGIFDGSGHVISNLALNGNYGGGSNSGVRYSDVGFFGSLSGTAKNFSLKNVVMSLSGNATHYFVGSVAGRNSGTISNVSILNVSGSVTASYVTGTYSTGSDFGLFNGYNKGTIADSLIVSGSLSTSIEPMGHVFKKAVWAPLQAYYAGKMSAENDGSISSVYLNCSLTTSNVSSSKTAFSNSSFSALLAAVTQINTNHTTRLSSYIVGGLYKDNLTPFTSEGVAEPNATSTATETNAAFLALKTCDPTNAYSEAKAFKDKYDSDVDLQNVANATTTDKDDNGNTVTAYTSVDKMNYMLTRYASNASQANVLNLSTASTSQSTVTFLVVLGVAALASASAYIYHRQKAK